MNHLAKHFFDYQSFVNLPHKAIQLHKTPCQQAGVDPSANWAPKSRHYAGKNLPAPAARSNRNYLEPEHSTRHGRPSKLEFRNWGDRHGELHDEKIVPHKDAWMVSFNGDFKHFQENDIISEDTPSGEYFPKFPESILKTSEDIEMLTILTLSSHMEFVTATIKKIRMRKLPAYKQAYVKIQLFDGTQLIEERQSNNSIASMATPLRNRRLNGNQQKRINELISSSKSNSINFLIKHLSFLSSPEKKTKLLKQSELLNEAPIIVSNHHNGGLKLNKQPLINKTTGDAYKEIILTTTQKRRAFYHHNKHERERSASCSSTNSSFPNSIDDSSDDENIIELGDSFLLHLTPERIQQSYIFVQIYVKNISSNLNNQKNNNNINNLVENTLTSSIVNNQNNKNSSASNDEEKEEASMSETIQEDLKEDELIAGCIIGSVDHGSRSHFHWREMRRKKGLPICMWHRCVRLPKHLLNMDKNKDTTNECSIATSPIRQQETV